MMHLNVAITSGHCEGNSYNKITNASTCSTAATSLGYIYNNTIDNSSGQQRCFVSSSDNKAYYNQYNTGNVDINSQSSAYLCKRGNLNILHGYRLKFLVIQLDCLFSVQGLVVAEASAEIPLEPAWLKAATR